MELVSESIFLIISGPPLEVETNILIRSMGPVSEEKMVSYNKFIFFAKRKVTANLVKHQS